MRTILGLFLVAHGLVTAFIWAAPKAAVSDGQLQPPDPSHSWLLGDVRALSVALGVAVGIALAVAGFAFLIHQTWWPTAAIGAGVASVALFAIFFTPWWLAGVAISVALIVAGMRAGSIV